MGAEIDNPEKDGGGGERPDGKRIIIARDTVDLHKVTNRD